MSEAADFIDEPCLNCGDPTPGRFCRACGQRKGEVRKSMRRLIADVLEDQLSITSALPRTLTALFLKPGKLTAEYAAGRIASYIAPFRLYLVASVIFFLVLSVASQFGLDDQVMINDRTVDEMADTRAPADRASGAVQGVDSVAGDTVDSARAAGTAPDTGGIAAGQASGPPPSAEPAPERRRPIGIVITDEDMQGDSINWSNVVNTGIPVLDDLIVARAGRLQGMEPRAALREVLGSFLEYAPMAMFVLLPVFALLLKVINFRSRRYYVEHFVFALHYHAFAFLIFVAIIIIPDALHPGLLMLWLFLYLPIALRRVYGQGYFKTFVKWIVLSSTYSVLIGFGIFATAIIAFLAG